MPHWTLPEVNEDTPSTVREAWRSHPTMAVAEPPAGEDKRAMQLTVLAGVVGGVAACAAILLLT